MSNPLAFNLPVSIGPSGAQPQSPAVLLAQLKADALAQVPGITLDLPASLLEDVTSTQVAGLALMDQARVELLNSISPNSANAFVLVQMGRALGLQLGTPTNT